MIDPFLVACVVIAFFAFGLAMTIIWIASEHPWREASAVRHRHHVPHLRLHLHPVSR